MSRRSAEGRPRGRGFPVVFRPPALACWASCSRRGLPPSSRSAYQVSAKASARTPTGFPRSTHPSHGRIGCPLYPETTRCSAAGPIPPTVARPLFQGARSYRPGPHPISRSCLLRGVVKGSLAFTRPAFSLARSSLDGTRTTLGTLPGLRTPQTRGLQSTPRRETGIEHSPGATVRPTSPHLLPSSSLAVCDLVSHDRRRHGTLRQLGPSGQLGGPLPGTPRIRRQT